MAAKPDLEAKLADAQAALASGNSARTLELCREVLEADPRYAGAHLIAGTAQSKAGNLDETIRHLTAAYELDPGSFAATYGLCRAYRLTKNLSAAIRFGTIAVELFPDQPIVHVELGMSYLDAFRLTQAEVHLREALKWVPRDYRARVSLSQCLDAQGRPDEARAMLREAIQTKRPGVEELLATWTRFVQQNFLSGASEYARAALDLDPGSTRARGCLARALVESGEGDEAVRVIGKLNPADCNESQPLYNFGSALQSLGDAEGGRAFIEREIEIAPENPAGWRAYFYKGKTSDSDREKLRWIERLLGQPGLDDVGLSDLHFALGKGREDLGEFESAMSHYDAANAAMYRAKFGVAPYDPAKLAELTDRMIQIFPGPILEHPRPESSESEVPVFVVGTIRSGTSLVEQILASHPEVGGIGEDPFWSRNMHDVVELSSPEINAERLRAATHRYLALVQSKRPGKRRVVDKAPGNCHSLGFLYRAFPRARVIHTRRSPRDVCVSMYTTPNRAELPYSHAKSSLVDAYRQYERLMSYLRAILPEGWILDVAYEDLVRDPEPQIRRMIEFLGLDWDDACLRHQDNPHVTATPSSWQVRQPIYRSSTERWRRFEPWLGEIMSLPA